MSLAEAWEGEVLSSPHGGRRRAAGRLIAAVAGLYATAHQRGFVPRDSHSNNILVRYGPDPVAEAAFVDVYPAWVARRAASLRRSARSLAQIDHYFHRTATRSERFRFLRRYLSLRDAGGADSRRRSLERRLIGAVLRVRRTHARRLARHRDKRLKWSGRYFAPLRMRNNWQATVTLALERRRLFPEVNVPDRTTRDWQAILAPLVDAIEAGQTDDLSGAASSDLCGEVSRARSFSESVRWTLAASPHRNAFERCHRLRHRDLPAELILAYGQRRRAGMIDATFLIRPRTSGKNLS
jgi:hypothetical protein